MRAASRLIPGIAWQGYKSLEDQRSADNILFGHALHDETPLMAWRWQGDLDDGALDLSTTFLVRDPTIVPPLPLPQPPLETMAPPSPLSVTGTSMPRSLRVSFGPAMPIPPPSYLVVCGSR